MLMRSRSVLFGLAVVTTAGLASSRALLGAGQKSAAQKSAREPLSKDDPEAQCLPTGVPRQAPYPWRVLQTATHMFFLFEGNIHSYRQIFLDGRKHPEDPDPTWYGHSV